jgi:precorrin-6B methylase 2
MNKIIKKILIKIVPSCLKRARRKILNKLQDLRFGFVYTNDSVEGAMTRGELNWLFLTAKKMNYIVEIGSWKGRSTHALLSGCSGIVYAVDTFKNSTERKDSYEDFIKNVGHFKNLKVYKADSLEAAREFEDKSIDMVFIDADHSYEAVKADIEAWLPKVKRLICGHDYDPEYYAGLVKAVDEKFGKVNSIYHIWFYYL